MNYRLLLISASLLTITTPSIGDADCPEAQTAVWNGVYYYQTFDCLDDENFGWGQSSVDIMCPSECNMMDECLEPVLTFNQILLALLELVDVRRSTDALNSKSTSYDEWRVLLKQIIEAIDKRLLDPNLPQREKTALLALNRASKAALKVLEDPTSTPAQKDAALKALKSAVRSIMTNFLMVKLEIATGRYHSVPNTQLQQEKVDVNEGPIPFRFNFDNPTGIRPLHGLCWQEQVTAYAKVPNPAGGHYYFKLRRVRMFSNHYLRVGQQMQDPPPTSSFIVPSTFHEKNDWTHVLNVGTTKYLVTSSADLDP